MLHHATVPLFHIEGLDTPVVHGSNQRWLSGFMLPGIARGCLLPTRALNGEASFSRFILCVGSTGTLPDEQSSSAPGTRRASGSHLGELGQLPSSAVVKIIGATSTRKGCWHYTEDSSSEDSFGYAGYLDRHWWLLFSFLIRACGVYVIVTLSFAFGGKYCCTVQIWWCFLVNTNSSGHNSERLSCERERELVSELVSEWVS